MLACQVNGMAVSGGLGAPEAGRGWAWLGGAEGTAYGAGLGAAGRGTGHGARGTGHGARGRRSGPVRLAWPIACCGLKITPLCVLSFKYFAHSGIPHVMSLYSTYQQ